MYVTRQSLQALCPKRQLDAALDDAGDGDTDALLAGLLDFAENKVHAILGPDYPAPLAEPVPAAVLTCVTVFALYELWARNGFKADDNPRAKDAEASEKMLAPYASGERKLYAPAADDDNLVSEVNSLDSLTPMV